MSEEMKLDVPPPAETKKPWASKTNWVALIVAVAPFFPSVQMWISANPELFAQSVGAIFMVLRMISQDKIKIK